MIYEKVMKYCEENDLSVLAFEKKCGLSNATVAGWKKNNHNPSLPTLQKIVAATGIPIEKWVEE